LAEATNLSLEVEEAQIPLSSQALHTAGMLGLDPLNVANEGKVLAVVAEADAERALAAWRGHPLGKDAARIGRFCETSRPWWS